MIVSNAPADASDVARLLALTGDAPNAAVEIVTLAEAKEHIKVLDDSEDTLIAGMLAAAIGTIDGPQGWLGRALTPQTIVRRFEHFGYLPAALPYPPLIEVVSIEHRAGNAWAAVDPLTYEVEDGRLVPFPGSWWPVAGYGVRLTYRAGYDGQEGRILPAPIRAAILLMTGDLHRNRSTVAFSPAAAVPMSTSVQNLLAPFQVWS